MPLSKDPNDGGAEADGSISTAYRGLCYENGVFRRPDFTVADIQRHCIEEPK